MVSDIFLFLFNFPLIFCLYCNLTSATPDAEFPIRSITRDTEDTEKNAGSFCLVDII